MVADVWEKDVWDFQAKSGSSGSCTLFLHFLGNHRSSKNVFEKRLEVPDILLPDILDQPTSGGVGVFHASGGGQKNALIFRFSGCSLKHWFFAPHKDASVTKGCLVPKSCVGI